MADTTCIVLVDDEPVSFLALRAHILPGLIKSILEHVNCRSIYYNNSVAEE